MEKVSLDDLRNISQLALEILKIAEGLVQKKPLDIDTLYRDARKKLDYPVEEINQTIYELILKKILIPEKKIVKTQVLANNRRDTIYKHILNNPGTHLREIRDELNLQPHLTNLHLKVLESFNYIYRKKYLKYRVYFPADFNRRNEDAILALKNEKAENIFRTIQTLGEVSLTQLEAKFAGDISPKMINYHLEPLISSALIISVKKEDQEFFTINNETFERIEKYLQPKEIAPLITEKLIVKRAYDYVGGDIRFKIVVENSSRENIKNIKVNLNIKEQFEVTSGIQMVSLLEPEESRGLDFTLVPLTCGKSKIHGTVIYYDSNDQEFSSQINPVLVQIKCPLVEPKILKLLDVLKMKERFQVSHVEIPYRNLSQANAFSIARDQIASLDVSEIEEGTEGFSTLFSGAAKVSGNPLLVDLRVNHTITIDIYMEDIKQATGFMAYIKNLINLAINYNEKISTSFDKVRIMIFNAFEFSSRLLELFEFCERKETIDDILIILKELQIKSESYFPDLRLAESLITWYSAIEKFEEKDVFSRIYLNLQYDIQIWLEMVITFSETNAKIYYDSNIDQRTHNEITNGILQLRNELNQMARKYFRSILYMLMIIHKQSGLSIYNHSFVETILETDLISGFLTAIQSFGSEISRQKTTMRKLSYEHFEIELYDGELGVAALITTGPPNSLTIHSLNDFIRRFELQFHDILKNFAGNVGGFAPAKDLIQDIFLQ